MAVLTAELFSCCQIKKASYIIVIVGLAIMSALDGKSNTVFTFTNAPLCRRQNIVAART